MKENNEPNNRNNNEASVASHSSTPCNSDEQHWYDSEWLTVIQKVERDNTACELYCDTIKWLDERYTLTPKN